MSAVGGTARRRIAPIARQIRQLQINLRLTDNPQRQADIRKQIANLEQRASRVGRTEQARVVRERQKVARARVKASRVGAQSAAVNARTEFEKTTRRLEREQKQRDIVSASSQRQQVARKLREQGFDPNNLQQAQGRFVDKATTNPEQRARARQQAFTPVGTPAVTITGAGSASRQLEPDVPESTPEVPLRASQTFRPPPPGAVVPQSPPQQGGGVQVPDAVTPMVVEQKKKQPDLINEFFAGLSAPAENLARTVAAFPEGVAREATGLFTGLGSGEGQRFFEREVQPKIRPTIIDEQLGRISGEEPERNRVGVREIGEILGEAALIAVPVGAGRLAGLRGAGRTVKPPTTPLTKSPQQLIAGARKTGKSEVFRPTNFFRRQVPGDVFAQDTASTFGRQRIPLGQGPVRQPGEFIKTIVPLGTVRTTITTQPLGRGIGSTIPRGGSGGTGLPSTPGRPSTPPPESAPRSGGQILQQLSKQVEQQAQKGSAKFIKLGKGKGTLLSQVQKPKGFTQQKVSLGRSTRTKVIQRARVPTAVATTALLPKTKQKAAAKTTTQTPNQRFSLEFDERLKLKQKQDTTFKIGQPTRQTITPKTPTRPPTRQTILPIIPTTQTPITPTASPPGRPIIPIGFIIPPQFGGGRGGERGRDPRGRKRRVLTPVGDRPGSISLAGFDIKTGSERELDREEARIRKASKGTVNNGKRNILDDPIGKITF